jgi:polyisoprenoid-binding protein YceI
MQTLSSLTYAVVCLVTLGLFQSDAPQTAQSPSRAARQRREPAPRPVPIKDGKVELNAKTTTIQFVGTHAGDRPDPRTGYFGKFDGELSLDESAKAPEAVKLEIDTASLVTPIGRLTGHLQSPDFFDVRQFPKATFESTKIEPVSGKRGEYEVTGDLTIRDVTKAIAFPARVRVNDRGLVLTSKFEIKRSEYGITFGPDRVVEEVAMTVTVGKPTPKITPQ